MISVEFDDLVATHGFEKAQELFETFKTSKPTTEISPDFAMQIIPRLGDLSVKIEKMEWGLENLDSDSNLQWCEHYHLIIPQFDAKVLIEVGDSHYYVQFESGSGDSDDDTFKHWEYIPGFIERCVQVFHGTLFAQLVFDESREFPFGVLTFADGLCTDSVDVFGIPPMKTERALSRHGGTLLLTKEKKVTKFRVLAKEVIYYEAVVEAASEDEAKQFAANNDELFVENDSSGIKISEAEKL